jgi:hypothetical protein
VLRLAVHLHVVPVARDAMHAVVVVVLHLAVQHAVKVRQTKRRALVATKWKVVRQFANC